MILLNKRKKLLAERSAIDLEIKKVNSQIAEESLSRDYTIRENMDRLSEAYDSEKTADEILEIASSIKEAIIATKENDISYEPTKILGEKIKDGYSEINFLSNIQIKFPKRHTTIVAAPPKIGKTTFLINVAWYCIHNGIPSVFLSNEMTRQELTIKLLAVEFSIRNKISYQFSDIVKFYNTSSEFKKDVIAYLEEGKKIFTICDVSKFTSTRICGIYEKAVSTLGVKPIFVFLDYAQRIAPEAGVLKLDRRQQTIFSAEIIREKAKLSDAVWIIGSQQNKDGNTKESAIWEEDCGQLINLSRDRDESTGEFDRKLYVDIRLSRFYKSFSRYVDTDLPSGVIGAYYN